VKEELSLFKCLSDETRLRIMILLSKKELCVCQLEWALGLTQAKVSRHLAVLKNAGLVQNRRKGLWVFYSLGKPKDALEKMIHKCFKEYFLKKYEIFRKDVSCMKRCLIKPLEKLSTRR